MGKNVSACEEAAGTVGSMAADNALNQDAFQKDGAPPLLLELVLTADRSIKASSNAPASRNAWSVRQFHVLLLVIIR